VIISDLNIKSIACLPAKANPILIVDSDAVLSRAISLQRLQAIRWWRRQVPKFFGAVDLNQFPKRDRKNGLKSPHAALPEENRFRIAIAKRSDQTTIILWGTLNVGREIHG
jgi:hypothetical protein